MTVLAGVTFGSRGLRPLRSLSRAAEKNCGFASSFSAALDNDGRNPVCLATHTAAKQGPGGHAKGDTA